MKQQLTSTPEGLPLDEDTFQHLLAAAYVLQEEGVRPKPFSRDHTEALSEIVEAQGLIHSQQLDLPAATSLIAERVQKITDAAGVAIGMLEGEDLVYSAATGSAAGEAGFRLPIDNSLSVHCLRSGQILQSPDAEKDPRLSVKLCRERGIRSLIALPVYHESKVAAVLELWFASIDAFQEHDVRTCQLMAGLVGEAIARNAELEWKQALAAERAAMLDALDKLKPQLERLTNLSATNPSTTARPRTQPTSVTPPEEQPVPEPTPVLETQPVSGTICGGCGHELGEEESFCGLCGTARAPEKSAGSRLQSKWASLWRMQQSVGENHSADPYADSVFPADFAMEPPREEATEELPDVDFATLDFSTPESEALTVVDRLAIEPEPVENDASAPSHSSGPSTSLVSPWSSALRARAWLESLKAQQPGRVWLTKQWHARRANVYLVIAAILLLVVLSGLATRSTSNTVSGNTVSSLNARRRKTPPPPQLTLFEKMLVGLGLAEPPPASVYLGNPNTQVWVDVHTALYYCPGADLYGKTPGGNFATQHGAQQDQFEPASRKACD